MKKPDYIKRIEHTLNAEFAVLHAMFALVLIQLTTVLWVQIVLGVYIVYKFADSFANGVVATAEVSEGR